MRTAEERLRQPGAHAVQWFGVLGAPVAWAAEEVVSYATTQHACSTGSEWLLYLYSFCALAVGAAALAAAWRSYAVTRPPAKNSGGAPEDRTRALGILGLMTAALFTLAILASAVPKVILSPCD